MAKVAEEGRGALRYYSRAILWDILFSVLHFILEDAFVSGFLIAS